MTATPEGFDLRGQLALVVGASRGIGAACAEALAGAGADLALAGRDVASLAQVASSAAMAGRTVTTHAVDVLDVASVRSLVREVAADRGIPDIVLYNAGTNRQRAALDVTEDDWEVVHGTNLRGAFFTAQAAGRLMVERGSGRIITIASTFAVVGFPNRVTYAASKGGVLQMTRALAVEWAAHGVTVNAIGPTAVHTKMNAELFADPAWRTEVLGRIPAGRFAEPRDVAGAVVYLASPAAAMVTGQILMVDGGWTAI